MFPSFLYFVYLFWATTNVLYLEWCKVCWSILQFFFAIFKFDFFVAHVNES